MPNTYSQIIIQFVFAVQGRQNLISRTFREELHKFITGIVRKRNQKLLTVFVMPDHVHLLIGLSTNINIADLMRDIKSASSKFINDNNWIHGKFHWQEGYGAFSYSKSQLNRVIKYINNQEIHHKKRTFKEEYLEFLKKFNIDYKDEYLFEWIESD
jgi:REP element-mobilizing transposase RayT